MEIKYGFRGVPGTLEILQNDVGKGWADILARLVTDLEQLGWNGEVVQVKEKFGGLRFYVNSASDAVHDRIGQAADESYKTCEFCGQPGRRQSDGWIKVVCEACHYQRHYERRGFDDD